MPEYHVVTGSSFRPARIDLNIDLRWVEKEEDFRNAILRTVFHEFHHVLRWDGPGYGRSLGEALVSEGLAQAFVHEVMVCPPESWENALAAEQLAEAGQLAHSAWYDESYKHDQWFFGTGQLPNWAGYSLGAYLVGRYLEERNTSALQSATLPVEAFDFSFVDFFKLEQTSTPNR